MFSVHCFERIFGFWFEVLLNVSIWVELGIMKRLSTSPCVYYSKMKKVIAASRRRVIAWSVTRFRDSSSVALNDAMWYNEITKLHKIFYSQRNSEGNINNSAVSTVHADGQALLSTRASAGTVMNAKFRSDILRGLHFMGYQRKSIHAAADGGSVNCIAR